MVNEFVENLRDDTDKEALNIAKVFKKGQGSYKQV